MLKQEIQDLMTRTIAQAKPDKLGWRTEEKATMIEIAIFGNQNEAIIACIFPDLLIGMTF